jgi:hypothetical protein
MRQVTRKRPDKLQPSVIPGSRLSEPKCKPAKAVPRNAPPPFRFPTVGYQNYSQLWYSGHLAR